MHNRVRQSFRAVTAVLSRRTWQFASVALVRPAIGRLGGDAVMAGVVLVVVLIAVLVAGVVMPAVWSVRSTRRRAALAVLDRLLRWKGR